MQVQPESGGRGTVVVGLDVLRFCAAMFVLCFHYFYFATVEPVEHAGTRAAIGAAIPWPELAVATSWGWVGAELFFVISGFVIVMSAVRKSARDFAIERAGRLLPALFVFSSLSLLVVAGAGLLSPGEALLRWFKAVTLFPQGPWIDGVVWTLSVELVFYCGILALLVTGRIERIYFLSKIAAVVLALFWALVLADALAGLSPLASLLDSIRTAYAFKLLLVTTGSFFLIGILAYEVYTRGLTVERGLFIFLGVCASLAAITSKAYDSPGVASGHPVWIAAAVWLACCTACALAIALERKLEIRPRMRRNARALGLTTYPLYLFHNIAGAWLLGRIFSLGANRWTSAALAIGLAILISFAFATLLERRIAQALRQGLRSLLARAEAALSGWRARGWRRRGVAAISQVLPE